MSSSNLNTVPLEQLTFGGNETENVSSFFRNVKRVAFAQGYQRDNKWVADYVETCLIDKALEWYDALDEKTQADFQSLRTAMLQRFSRGAHVTNIISAPLAAPTPVSPAALVTPPQL